MKFSSKDANVIRTTPRGTHADTVVVISAPKRKVEPRSPQVHLYCTECGGRVSYRSPSWLCKGCRNANKETYRQMLYFWAISQQTAIQDITPQIGGPFWNFYVAPFLHKCVEISRQDPGASYTSLYS